MRHVARIISLSLGHILCLGVFANLGCSSPDDTAPVIEVSGIGNSLDETAYTRQTPSVLQELVSLLPANTRGVLSVDFESLYSSTASHLVDQLLGGSGLDETLSRPFGMIDKHRLGIDLSECMLRSMLVQTTDPRDGSMLISKIRFDSLAAIPGLVDLVSAPEYKQHEILFDPLSRLSLTLLPDQLLVIANSKILHSVIDVFEGDVDSAASGQMGAYLVDLNNTHPIHVVYGLPAMYKEVRTGLTLKSAVALSLWLEIADKAISGEATFYLDRAAEFATTFNQATEMYTRPPVTVIQGANGKTDALVVPISSFALDQSQNEALASRHELKMLYYLMEAKDNISGLESGQTQPWKNFFVKDDPPSLFINWEIPESKVQSFSAAVLPLGFEMKKLKILESDEPAYYLVLNAYTATGMVAGVRQEWSVFVTDPITDKARFLVIEALSKNPSMDPVNMFTRGQPVTHVEQDGQLVTQAYKKKWWRKTHYFTSKINWPQPNPTFARSAREFVSANDYIFWGNGVADRGLYAGVVYNRDLTIIPAGQYEIINDTPWSEYINPQPKSVYVYQNELDILVAMWANLDADYLDMTQLRRQRLVRTRNNLVTGLMKADVTNAFRGTDHAILGLEIENSTPAVFFNYRIDDSKVQAFESSLDLPDGFQLAPTTILEDDDHEAYYLTLGVYETKDAVEGIRAEWWVYIDDGSDHEHVMVIDLMTQDSALDPLVGLHLPSVVEHEIQAGMLTTTLSSASIEFSASIPIAQAVSVMHTTDWVETREFVCYRNAICDKFYVDGGTLTEPMLSVDPQSVSLLASTPWSDFIEPLPSSILIRPQRQILGEKPWVNVNSE